MPTENAAMYRFKTWITSADPVLLEVKKQVKKVKEKCKSIPKTKGHKYQESIANALEVVLDNKNAGCGGEETGSRKCYSVSSSGAGSGAGDVTISGDAGDIKIECKQGHAQGGDMTFAWKGGSFTDPSSWVFRGIAKKMCPTDKEKSSLKAALCRSITNMLTDPTGIGACLVDRAKKIHGWQVAKYGSGLVGNLEYPLLTLKEAWLIAADKFPMKCQKASVDGTQDKATYFNILGKEEYWGSLQDILIQKGDHYIQFWSHGLYRVADDPMGVGSKLGIPMLTDAAKDNGIGGRVEVRVRPSGFSKTGGRLVKKAGGEMGAESAKAKARIERNRALILKCSSKPKSGMHIHVPELGKKTTQIDLYDYSVPGNPSLKVRMAGKSSSEHYDYVASAQQEEGEYIGTIDFTMDPIQISADEWYVVGNFKHRVSKVALSAILRIDDKVTATLSRSPVSLDRPDDLIRLIDALPEC
jgi:hypothetical protein